MRRRLLAVLFLLTGVVFARFCVVILDEREMGFRTLLGDPDPQIMGFPINRSELTEPGLYVRIPGLHQLYRFDRRRLRYDADPRRLLTKEKLPIEVDYYAIWRIESPQVFFESFRTQRQAVRRLDNVTYSELRETLALHSLQDLLSERRPVIMKTVAERCDAQLSPLGIRVLDLRMSRSDYPEANVEQILSRMRAERQRFAKKFRAEGEERAQEIRSIADRESRIIQAKAARKAARTRGEGDAGAAGIFANAYGEDAEFYAFVKSLEAYTLSLDEGTTLILTPRSHFLRYFLPTNQKPTRGLPQIGAPREPERAP